MKEYIIEKSDISKVSKLEKLTSPATFWDDVRRLTKNCMSDHHIKRWQILAEARYRELKGA